MWLSRHESELGEPASSAESDATSVPSSSDSASSTFSIISRCDTDVDSVDCTISRNADEGTQLSFSLRFLGRGGYRNQTIGESRHAVLEKRPPGMAHTEIRHRHLKWPKATAAYRKEPQVPPQLQQRNILSSVRNLMGHTTGAGDGEGRSHRQRPRNTRKRSVANLRFASANHTSEKLDQRAACSRVENLHRALDNKLVEQALQAFCKRTWSWENVAFVRQVRELEELAALQGTAACSLQGKLTAIAETFVKPGCATEVNVKGESQKAALVAIAIAVASLEERRDDGAQQVSECREMGDSRGELKLASDEEDTAEPAAAAFAAVRALTNLSREVMTVVIHDIWPRFRESHEFQHLIEREEMRRAKFKDLDGSIVTVPGRSSSLRKSLKLHPMRREMNVKVVASPRKLPHVDLVTSPQGVTAAGVGGNRCSGASDPMFFSATAAATPRHRKPLCRPTSLGGGRTLRRQGGGGISEKKQGQEVPSSDGRGRGDGFSFRNPTFALWEKSGNSVCAGGVIVTTAPPLPTCSSPLDAPPSLRPLGLGVGAADVGSWERQPSPYRGESNGVKRHRLRISGALATAGEAMSSERFVCSPVRRQSLHRCGRSFATAGCRTAGGDSRSSTRKFHSVPSHGARHRAAGFDSRKAVSRHFASAAATSGVSRLPRYGCVDPTHTRVVGKGLCTSAAMSSPVRGGSMFDMTVIGRLLSGVR